MEEKKSCLSYGFLFLIIVSLSIFFFPLTGIVTEKIYKIATSPTYEATIVSFSSYETECKTSEGNTFSCTKYSTFVEFYLDNGTKIHTKTTSSSSEAPIIGEPLHISFNAKNNTADELTWMTLTLFFILLSL